MRRNEYSIQNSEVTKKAGNAAKSTKKGWDSGLPSDVGDVIIKVLTGGSPELAGGAAKTLWNQISPGPDDHSYTLDKIDLKNYNSSVKAKSRDHWAKVKKERDQYVNRINNPAGWETQIGSYNRRRKSGSSRNSSREYGIAGRQSKSTSGYKKYSKQLDKRNNRAASYTGRYAPGRERGYAARSRGGRRERGVYR